VVLDFAEQTKVFGNHEPFAYALVRITETEVVVHTDDYVDASEVFDTSAIFRDLVPHQYVACALTRNYTRCHRGSECNHGFG
jgi:hypothetical protein